MNREIEEGKRGLIPRGSTAPDYFPPLVKESKLDLAEKDHVMVIMYAALEWVKVAAIKRGVVKFDRFKDVLDQASAEPRLKAAQRELLKDDEIAATLHEYFELCPLFPFYLHCQSENKLIAMTGYVMGPVSSYSDWVDSGEAIDYFRVIERRYWQYLSELEMGDTPEQYLPFQGEESLLNLADEDHCRLLLITARQEVSLEEAKGEAIPAEDLKEAVVKAQYPDFQRGQYKRDILDSIISYLEECPGLAYYLTHLRRNGIITERGTVVSHGEPIYEKWLFDRLKEGRAEWLEWVFRQEESPRFATALDLVEFMRQTGKGPENRFRGAQKAILSID
jgi:hypothetical protein